MPYRRSKIRTGLTQLMDAVDPAAGSVDARLETIMGQRFPSGSGRWRMNIHDNVLRLDALEPTVAAMMEVLYNQQGPQILQLLADAQKAQAFDAQLAADLEANTLADEAQAAWLALADAKATEAKTESAATKLAQTAASLKATAQQVQLDAQNLRLLAAETSITATQTSTTAALAAAATAQAKADAADVKAQTATTKADAAQTKADAAQTKADTATTTATTAQTTATTAISNAAAANTTATSAQATATSAQSAVTTLAARLRTKRVATPAMALGATAQTTITWDTPFADANYTPLVQLEGGSILGLKINIKSHTAAAVVVETQNALGIVLLAGAGTLLAQALHD